MACMPFKAVLKHPVLLVQSDLGHSLDWEPVLIFQPSAAGDAASGCKGLRFVDQMLSFHQTGWTMAGQCVLLIARPDAWVKKLAWVLERLRLGDLCFGESKGLDGATENWANGTDLTDERDLVGALWVGLKVKGKAALFPSKPRARLARVTSKRRWRFCAISAGQSQKGNPQTPPSNNHEL